MRARAARRVHDASNSSVSFEKPGERRAADRARPRRRWRPGSRSASQPARMPRACSRSRCSGIGMVSPPSTVRSDRTPDVSRTASRRRREAPVGRARSTVAAPGCSGGAGRRRAACAENRGAGAGCGTPRSSRNVARATLCGCVGRLERREHRRDARVERRRSARSHSSRVRVRERRRRTRSSQHRPAVADRAVGERARRRARGPSRSARVELRLDRADREPPAVGGLVRRRSRARRCRACSCRARPRSPTRARRRTASASARRRRPSRRRSTWPAPVRSRSKQRGDDAVARGACRRRRSRRAR